MTWTHSKVSVVLLMATATSAAAQQVADSLFRPPIARAAYERNSGPLLLIDEAHENFHTAGGRYYAFAELLRRDGYRVSASAAVISEEALRGADLFVMANARKTLTNEEVSTVRAWVERGGALMLIVDHPPNVRAAIELGRAFGVELRDAGAFERGNPANRIVFRRLDGSLGSHAITAGVDSVVTFTGSSFRLSGQGWPLLVLGSAALAEAETDDPNPVPIGGELQGAVLTAGRGRVAVFAEAAMFSAQLSGTERRPMGMNAPAASQNVQLLLNVMHWLSGSLQ